MNLLKLLKVQLEKNAVGTLLLGEKNSFREIFFEQNQAYLCGDQYSGKLDLHGLISEGVIGSTISLEELDGLVARCDLRQDLLPDLLASQALITEDLRDELVARQIREEIIDLVFNNGDTFHFQDGRVPEQLLENGTAMKALPLDDLIEELEQRSEDFEFFGSILPSRDEVFVKTAEGMAHAQTHPDDFGVQKLFVLIDGFRTLSSLMQCSQLYDHYIMQLIVDSLEAENLKKTLLPEIKNIDPETIEAEDARRYLPYFKNAVRHASNAMLARERLAQIYERLGDESNAVVQYNFIGDALYRMKKPAKAITVYQKALDLKPGDVMVTDKVVRIYQVAAEQEVLRGDTGQAIRLLENALTARPDDTEVFQRLVEILGTQRQYKYLTEVCDRVVAHGKRVGNPEIGIAACRHLLAKHPENALYQKKLINVFLDSGEVERAAMEMASLVRSYAEKGHRERARDLAEKIKRLQGGGVEVQRVYKMLSEDLGFGSARRRRNRLVIGLSMCLAMVFTIYQGFSYSVWQSIVKQAHAAEAETAKSRNFAQSPRERELKRLAHRGVQFVEQYPISVFRGRAETLTRNARLGVAQIERVRREKKQQILDRAKMLAQEGDSEAVKKQLAALLAIPAPGDLWRSRARDLLRRLDNVDQSAAELLAAARALEDSGEWREAYALYRKLLDRFPHSRLVQGLTLPVLVETIPPDVSVRKALKGGRFANLGQTPTVLRLERDEVISVEFVMKDHYPLSSEIFDADGQFNQFILERRPTWTREIPGQLSTLPAFHGDAILLATESGQVEAMKVSTGERLWKLQREEINWLLGSPLVTPEGTYLVWNDRKVMLIDSHSPPDRPDVAPSIISTGNLRGLARTGAFVLENGSLLVGTSRQQIVIFSREDLKRVGEIDLGAVPVAFSVIDRSKVVVTLETGMLRAIDTATQKILWSKSLPRGLATPPRLSGDSLVVVTPERDLMLLDPQTGIPRAVRSLAAGQQAAFDSVSGKLFSYSQEGKVESISLIDGKTAQQRQFELQGLNVTAGAGHLVLSYENRERFLVLDASNLEPIFAGRARQSVTHFVYSDEGVLAISTGKASSGKNSRTRLRLFSAKPYPRVDRKPGKSWER